MAILEVNAIDKSIGELLLSLDYYGIREVGIIADDQIFSTISKISKDLSLNLTRMKRDFESYLEFIKRPIENNEKMKNLIFIDQAFPVKGIGTVVLGFVSAGKVMRHQKLRAYPAGKEVEVKSIQIMDVDKDDAFPFARVGLALKGVEVEEVQKGSVLSEYTDFEMDETIELDFYSNKSLKTLPEVNEKVQINYGFSNINAQVTDIDNNKILFDCDKKIPKIPEIKYGITDLNKSPRILGVGKLGD